MTVIRLVSVLIGMSLWVLALQRLRHASGKRVDVWLYILSGLAVILIGLNPTLLDLPAEALSLGQVPGGRIMTLVIFATALSWIVVLDSRAVHRKSSAQFDQLVRAVTLTPLRPALVDIPPDRICVVMPAYNEAQNLSAVLPKVPHKIGPYDVQTVVIDDGSTDGSGKVAALHGALVVAHPFNRGGGAALRLGFDVATEMNARVVVTIDSDGQHDPGEIVGLVEPILSNQADIVIGSRLLGSWEKDSNLRHAGVFLFNTVLRIATGKHLTDCSSGFRAMRIEPLRRLTLVQDQYHTAELIILASKAGLRIVERPITVRHRLSGQSKKGHDLMYGYRFLRTVIKSWLT
jgi:Glycosyl transferase family 2